MSKSNRNLLADFARKAHWQQLIWPRPGTPGIATPEYLEQAYAGPPAEPMARCYDALKGTLALGLDLRSPTEEEARSDAATLFAEAADYIQKTAIVMTREADLFKAVPFQARHLQARMTRVDLAETAATFAENLARQLRQTATAERADAVRMADLAMAELECDMNRPTAEPALRQRIEDAARIPLTFWQKRLDRARRTEDGHEQLRAELQAQLEEARAQQPMSPPAPAPAGELRRPLAAPPVAAAPRRARRR